MNFVFQKVVEFAKANPSLTTVNMLLAATFPLDDMLYPYLSGKIVSNIQDKKPWLPLLICFVVLLIFMQFFYTTASLHDTKLIPKLHNFIRDGMFKDVVTQYKVFQHDSDLRLGEMMSRFIKIPENTVLLYELTKNNLIPNLLSFIATASYIIYREPSLGIVMLLCGILVIFLIISSPRHCMQSTTAQESSLAKFDEQTEDVLRNLHIVYTSNTLDKELERVSEVGDAYRSTYRSTARCVIVARYIAIVVLSIMLIYFVHYSYTRINSGKMAVGMFVTIFMTMTQWFNTMGWLASNMKTIVIEYGIVSAYAKLLTHRSQNNMIAPMPTPPKTGLYLHKVSYYIQGRTMPILSGIDLHIHPNERIALIGSIGSGKTTLLKIIAHLKTPTHGHIYFNGHQLAATSVGYVPQTPTLFDRTLYENIVYGVDGVTTADIDAIISALGLTEAFDNLENGLNTVVGKNGSVLSGGQRQLVQLMRVMLMDPPILVLDEVTASLDVETKKKLFKVLDILMKDKTVIMVTHDEHLMSQATRIVKLDEGKLINVSNAANDKQERRMYQ